MTRNVFHFPDFLSHHPCSTVSELNRYARQGDSTASSSDNSTRRRLLKGNDSSSYVTTAMCPPKYCCSAVEGCWFNETDSLCALNRDPDIPLCGGCLPGYYETMSAEGSCNTCEELHWWYILATFFTGAINMFLFYSGAKKEKEVPHPFMTYLNKTLMFFFQCLPFMTFRNPNQTLRPITELLGNLSPDSTEAGMCMFFGLNSRDKLWLNLAPPAILFFVMVMFWIAIRINMRKKKFPDAEDPKQALWEWLELENIALKAGVWSMCLVIYGT